MKEQQDAKGSAGAKSGVKKGLLIGLLAAAVIIACVAVVLSISGVSTKSKAVLSITELLDEDSLGLDLDVSVDIDGSGYDVEAAIRNAAAEDDIPVSRITIQGLSLYYAEEAIFLEDGTAYRLTGDSEDSETSLSYVLDYAAVLSLIKTYYTDSAASVSEEGDVAIYSITLDEETSLELLTALYPPAAEQISEMSTLSIDLYAESGTATAIVISGGAQVNNAAVEEAVSGNASSEEAGGASAATDVVDPSDDSTDSAGENNDTSAQNSTSLAVNVRMDILTGEDGSFTIPDAVLAAIAAGEYMDAPVLTDGLLRLLAAWNTLSSRDLIGADIYVGVDFGLISLYENMTWARTDADGEAINGITIGDNTWYFTDDWFEYGSSDTEEPADADAAVIDPLFLLETGYEVFMGGGFSIEEENGSYIYTVSLTQEQMETIVLTLIPDAEDLGISYKDSQFTAVVTGDEFTSLTLTSGGSVKILFTEVSIDLEIGLDLLSESELSGFTFQQ